MRSQRVQKSWHCCWNCSCRPLFWKPYNWVFCVSVSVCDCVLCYVISHSRRIYKYAYWYHVVNSLTFILFSAFCFFTQKKIKAIFFYLSFNFSIQSEKETLLLKFSVFSLIIIWGSDCAFFFLLFTRRFNFFYLFCLLFSFSFSYSCFLSFYHSCAPCICWKACSAVRALHNHSL